MPENAPFEWFGFWVRFVCGAILGASVGFLVLAQSEVGRPSGWAVLGIASLFGVASGFWGEAFWRTNWNWLRWFV